LIRARLVLLGATGAPGSHSAADSFHPKELDARVWRPVQKTLDAVPRIVERTLEIFRVNKLAIRSVVLPLVTAHFSKRTASSTYDAEARQIDAGK
jgi:hypothetical protein